MPVKKVPWKIALHLWRESADQMFLHLSSANSAYLVQTVAPLHQIQRIHLDGEGQAYVKQLIMLVMVQSSKKLSLKPVEIGMMTGEGKC